MSRITGMRNRSIASAGKSTSCAKEGAVGSTLQGGTSARIYVRAVVACAASVCPAITVAT